MRRSSLLACVILRVLSGCSSSGAVHPPPTTGTGGAEEGDTGGAGGGPVATGGSRGPVADAEAPSPDLAPPPDLGVDAVAVTPDAAFDGNAPRPDVATDSAPVRLDGPTAAYDPCPAKGKPCVVLPLGDSLTQGAGAPTPGGYRRELFHQVLAHGQSVTFVGSASSGPATVDGVPFPKRHEGHGGFSIQAIGQWLTDNNTIATYHPDIVLLHIGTNNGLRHPGANVPAALTALGALIDQITAADPRVLVLVALIIPSSTDDGVKQTAAYDAGIPAVVAARANAGKHVVVADVQRFFVADPNWKTDYLPTSDVHPIDAGYDAMGRGWYAALGPLLH